MERVVGWMTSWAMPYLARRIGLSIRTIFGDFPDQAQDTAYNVSHDDFFRLGSSQTLAHIANSTDELLRITTLELTNDTEEQGRGSYGAWTRIADLASFEQTA